MSFSRLHHAVQRFRGQVAQKRDVTEHALTDAHTNTLEQLAPALRRLYADLDEAQKAQSSNQQGEPPNTVPLFWLFDQGRVEHLTRTVASHMDTFASFAYDLVQKAQEWARDRGQYAADVLLRIAQPESEPKRPSLLSIWLARVRESLSPLFLSFGPNAAKGILDTLVQGVSLGKTVQEIADQVTQVLDEPRWRSLTIASTELYKAFNGVLMQYYQSNAQTVLGWLWHCRLSPTSCAACIALHGTIHQLDETLEDHPNGQCIPLPYVASMTEIQKGVDWFEHQDEQVKRAILGTDVAWDLYKTGRAALHDFVGVRHDHGYPASVYQRSAKQITKEQTA